MKLDLDTQDSNSQDLLEWRSAANTELVNIASKVDRIELHVSLHKKMLKNLRKRLRGRPWYIAAYGKDNEKY